MKKLTFLLICMMAAGALQGASTRIAIGVTFTNTPVNSNGFLLGTSSRQWRTNATNAALQFQITNSIGGNRTNFYLQILGNAYSNNVEVFYGAASNVVVLQGQPGDGLTASLSGNWGYLTFYTNPVTAGEAVLMPFTSESTNTRARIANGLVSALNSNASTKFDRTALPLSYYINDSTAQGLSNKTLHDFKGRTGEIAKVTVTNLWLPSTNLTGGAPGKLRFVSANNDPEASVYFDIHALNYEFPYPSISDGSSNFFDIVDFAAEGFETNRNIMTLGATWRYFPKLDTVPFYGFSFTNEWGTSQIFSNRWGSDVFVRYDMPVIIRAAMDFDGAGTLTNLTAMSASKGWFTTLRSAGFTGNISTGTNTATIYGGSYSNVNGLQAANVDLSGGRLSNVVVDRAIASNLTAVAGFDLTGDFATHRYDFGTLAAGVNVAVSFGTNHFIRLAGVAPGTIAGIAGGRDGLGYLVQNEEGGNVTLAVGTVDPVQGNRITTYDGLDLVIPNKGWFFLLYDTSVSRWKIPWTWPSLAYSTNSGAFVSWLNGVATNLVVRGDSSNAVPMQVVLAAGQTTNAFEIKDSSGAVLWSIDAAGVPSSGGAGGGDVTTAQLTAATNNVTTNAQAHLTASNVIAIARANQVGTDATNALTTATNNVTTNTASLLSIATNNVTTNLYQRLTDSNVIAIARANQVGTDATNALTTATNNVTTNTASLLSIATNNVTTNLYQRLTDSNVIAIARANQVGTDATNALNTKLGKTNDQAYGATFNLVTTNAGAIYNVGSNLVYTGTAGVTQTNVHIDFSFGNEFYLLLTNNAFLIPTNMRPFQVVNIEVWQDGTGSRSVAWQGTVSTNASGLALTNTANARNVITMKAGKYATNVFAISQAGFQ